jgi:hypothetical protein
MGFTLQGLLLDAIGAPLGAQALLTLPAGPDPSEEGRARRGRLQGLAPATSSCCRRNHKWFRPPIPSWGSSFQSLLLSSLALAFVAAPPLSPSSGFTFRPARVPGYRGVDKWNDPSPDRRLS